MLDRLGINPPPGVQLPPSPTKVTTSPVTKAEPKPTAPATVVPAKNTATYDPEKVFEASKVWIQRARDRGMSEDEIRRQIASNRDPWLRELLVLRYLQNYDRRNWPTIRRLIRAASPKAT